MQPLKKIIMLFVIALLYAGAIWIENNEVALPTNDYTPSHSPMQTNTLKEAALGNNETPQNTEVALTSNDDESQKDMQTPTELVNHEIPDQGKSEETPEDLVSDDLGDAIPQKETTEADSQTSQEDFEIYVVKPNDSLWRIAKNKYQGNDAEVHRGVQLIIAANPQIDDPSKIKAGQEIKLPSFDIELKKQTKIHLDKYTLPREHRVAIGDTLYTLARLYYHDYKKWYMIKQANPYLNDPCKLKEGTKLYIPQASGND